MTREELVGAAWLGGLVVSALVMLAVIVTALVVLVT